MVEGRERERVSSCFHAASRGGTREGAHFQLLVGLGKRCTLQGATAVGGTGEEVHTSRGHSCWWDWGRGSPLVAKVIIMSLSPQRAHG